MTDLAIHATGPSKRFGDRVALELLGHRDRATALLGRLLAGGIEVDRVQAVILACETGLVGPR
jgi:hypothetical protein